MKNIYLFTWDDQFEISQTLQIWKNKFIEKTWGDIYIIKEIEYEKVINIIFSPNLINSKKLVIIYWYPREWKWNEEIKKLDQFFEKYIDKIPNNIFIVFISYSPDKRSIWYKTIEKYWEIKEFKNDKKSYINFINKLSIETWIPKEKIEKIASQIWNDKFKIYYEIQKINIYKEINPKREQNIDIIINKRASPDIFYILDKIINKDEKVMYYLKNFDEFTVLWILYWWIKNTILIINEYKKWKKWEEISKKLNLHPYVVNSRLKNINFIDEKYLKNLFKSLINLENEIKSWKIPLDLFWLELKHIIMNNYNK